MKATEMLNRTMEFTPITWEMLNKDDKLELDLVNLDLISM